MLLGVHSVWRLETWGWSGVVTSRHFPAESSYNVTNTQLPIICDIFQGPLARFKSSGPGIFRSSKWRFAFLFKFEPFRGERATYYSYLYKYIYLWTNENYVVLISLSLWLSLYTNTTGNISTSIILNNHCLNKKSLTISYSKGLAPKKNIGLWQK